MKSIILILSLIIATSSAGYAKGCHHKIEAELVQIIPVKFCCSL